MVVEEFEGGRYLLLALWDHDGDRGQEEVEDAAGVVAEAAVAVAGVSAGEAGGDQGWEAEAEGCVGAVEGGHAAVAEGGVGADDAGTGADEDRVPAELGRRRVERADRSEGLVFAPICRGGSDVTGEEVAAAQSLDVSRQG